MHDLLNSKSQCYFKFDDKRQVQVVGIIQERISKDTGEKNIHWICLYSFSLITDELRDEGLKYLKDLLESTESVGAVFETSSKRVRELALAAGFEEVSRKFELRV